MHRWPPPKPSAPWVNALRVLWIAGVLGGGTWWMTAADPCEGLEVSGGAATALRGLNKAGVVVAVRYERLDALLAEQLDEVLPPLARQRSAGEQTVGARAVPTPPRIAGFTGPCQDCAEFRGEQRVELLLGPPGTPTDQLSAVGECMVPYVAPVLLSMPAGQPELPLLSKPDEGAAASVELEACSLDDLDPELHEAARGAVLEVVEATAERLRGGVLLAQGQFWPVADVGLAPARVEVHTGADAVRLAMYPARTLPGRSIPVELVRGAPFEDVVVAVAPSMLAELAMDGLTAAAMGPVRDGRLRVGLQPRLRRLESEGGRLRYSIRAMRAEGCGWADFGGSVQGIWDRALGRLRFESSEPNRVLQLGGRLGGRLPGEQARVGIVGRILGAMEAALIHEPLRGPAGQGTVLHRAWVHEGVLLLAGVFGEHPPPSLPDYVPPWPEPMPEPEPDDAPDPPGVLLPGHEPRSSGEEPEPIGGEE